METRGEDLAKELLDYTEKITGAENKKFITLEVSQRNYVAINLYLNTGFKKVGTKKNYYFDGSDAILMWKKI